MHAYCDPLRRALTCGSIALLAMLLCPSPSVARLSTTGRKYGLSKTYVKEEAHLQRGHKSNASGIVEQGQASGTFDAFIQIEMVIGAEKVTGSFVADLKGGSIIGTAYGKPHYSGKYASFKGTLTIRRGTGRYAGASGTASFYGAINRLNYKLTVQLIGDLRI
jgi:hypothetical protein